METIEQLEKEVKAGMDNLKALSERIESIKNKPKFEVGKWYKDEGGKAFVFNTGVSETNFGFGNDGTWVKKYFLENMSSDQNFVLATESEVSEALIKEAKRRGFKDGVQFKGVAGMKKNIAITIGLKYHIVFKWNPDGPNTGLYCDDSWIFHKGQWAEIIPQEEKIEIGGYKVMLHANGVDTTIDGHTFTKEFWKAAKVINENPKAIVKVGCSKQFDVSLETINKILDKLK